MNVWNSWAKYAAACLLLTWRVHNLAKSIIFNFPFFKSFIKFKTKAGLRASLVYWHPIINSDFENGAGVEWCEIISGWKPTWIGWLRATLQTITCQEGKERTYSTAWNNPQLGAPILEFSYYLLFFILEM